MPQMPGLCPFFPGVSAKVSKTGLVGVVVDGPDKKAFDVFRKASFC